MPGKDAELRELARVLEAEQGVYAAPMAEPLRKQAHFASANALRSRDAMGHSGATPDHARRDLSTLGEGLSGPSRRV